MRFLIALGDQPQARDTAGRIARELTALENEVSVFAASDLRDETLGGEHDVLISFGTAEVLRRPTGARMRVRFLSGERELPSLHPAADLFVHPSEESARGIFEKHPDSNPRCHRVALPEADLRVLTRQMEEECRAFLMHQTLQRELPRSLPGTVKEVGFRDTRFKIACVEHDGSWWSFIDEDSVRRAYWDIRPGETVFDIGAAYGSYSLSALALGAAELVAWSPQDEGKVMARSLSLNGFEGRCQIIESGLYDREGYLDPESQEFSDTGRPGFIAVERLDHFMASRVFNRLDWLKIDVEGAEVEVLRGARETLARFRPKILVENHRFKRDSIEEEVRRHLVESGLGYREIGTRRYSSWISHSLYVSSAKGAD
jgi:FkbM family methyltransferase